VWSRATREDTEVPWSRRLYLRGWLSWASPGGLAATLSGSWNSGLPYSVCLQPKGCPEEDLFAGRLPAEASVDLALRYRPPLHRLNLRLRAEAYNLFDRRIPTFDFSLFPMNVSHANFLAYYNRTGRTDAYLLRYGGVDYSELVDNPLTISPGRSVLLGVELEF